MEINSRIVWPGRLDKFCVVTGALVPVGLVVGNIGFELLVGLVGLGWIVRCFLAKENPFPWLVRHPLVIPWMVWYFCIVISLAVNGPGNKGWAHDIVFIRFVLFGIALIDISRRFPVSRYLLYGLAAGVIWAALNTLSAYIIGYDFVGKPLTRYTGKLRDASRISGASAYASAFFLAWGMLDDKLSTKYKWIIISLGLIAFVQLLQVHVRTAVIASAAGIFFATVFFVRKRLSLRTTILILAGILLAVGVFFQYNRLGGNLDSLYDRINFWKVVWYVWLDHPLLGVGISSFQDAYQEMALSGKVAKVVAPDGYVLPLRLVVTHAHNLILMLISSTGLLGLAAFLWLFVNALRSIYKNLNGFRLGLTTWPIVLLAVGLTGFNIYHSWYQALLAFWLILIGADDSGFEVGRSAD